jgi:hypothetical protein
MYLIGPLAHRVDVIMAFQKDIARVYQKRERQSVGLRHKRRAKRSVP